MKEKSLISRHYDLDEWDFACILIPDLDYESQLIAIRHTLRTHKNKDAQLEKELKELEEYAKKTTGFQNDLAVDNWGERFHSSIFQSAAHSMSAVGMLAPLTEAIFDQIFKGIKKNYYDHKEHKNDHSRRSCLEADYWNCHYAWGKSGKKDDLVRGIIQLSESTGLKPFLPDDIQTVLTVLFAYRNKMFHCGFEWPKQETNKFWKRIKNENWPENWLTSAKKGDDQWIIYLTKDFVQHCINTIEATISAAGKFVLKNTQKIKSK